MTSFATIKKYLPTNISTTLFIRKLDKTENGQKQYCIEQQLLYNSLAQEEAYLRIVYARL